MNQINPLDEISINDLERLLICLDTNYYQKEIDGTLVEGESDDEVQRFLYMHSAIMNYFLTDVNDDSEAVFPYSIEKIKEAIKTKTDEFLNTNTNN
jgi:hypothetical protein